MVTGRFDSYFPYIIIMKKKNIFILLILIFFSCAKFDVQPGILGMLGVLSFNIEQNNNHKHIFVTTTKYDGNFDLNSNGNGITEADFFCMTDGNYPGSRNYKALVSDGINRDFLLLIDWVFLSSTNYYQLNTEVYIEATDINRIFIFPLKNKLLASGGNVYWTGLNNDWSTSINICNGWTTNSNLQFGNFGKGNFVTNNVIFFGTDNCLVQKQIVCIEQ